MSSSKYFSGGLAGVALEQALQRAFEDIVNGYTAPDCKPLLCVIDPVAKEGDVRIVQLSAICDENSNDHEIRERQKVINNLFAIDTHHPSDQEKVISNLSATFEEATIQIKVDEEGLKVLLPTVKDIERFFELHYRLGEQGFFTFGH